MASDANEPGAVVPEAEAEAEAEAAATTPPGGSGYTAVVHFHGMGQQRRYESVSELVEQLDGWLRSHAGAFGAASSLLVRLVARREPLRDVPAGTEESVAYLRTSLRLAAPGQGARHPRLRFYEAYWAPETAGGTTAGEVARWLVAQAWRPLGILFAPWGAHGRSRRASLFALERRAGRSVDPGDVKKLAKVYVATQSTLGPRFRFRDFRREVARRYPDQREEPGQRGKPGQREKLEALASSWRWFHLRSALLTAAVVWLLLACLASSLGLTLLATLGGLRWLLQQVPQAASLLGTLGGGPVVGVGQAMQVTLALLSGAGVLSFLADYLGDVQQYVTYEEAEPKYERRARVLRSASRQLRHVLADVRCERVVIVAHSLGTMVALDTLLQLRGHNQAFGSGGNPLSSPLRLDKISHLVTTGSPIDKINYLFASFRTPYATYERVLEYLRGDLGDVPFSKTGRQPHIHWVNFWDRGDPVSGALDSVLPVEHRAQRVDNVQVASFAVPDPGASHGAYLGHPRVQEVILGALLVGHAPLPSAQGAAAPSPASPGLPWGAWLGPGRGHGVQAALLLVPLVLAILAPLALWEALFGAGWPLRSALALGLAALAAAAMLQRVTRLRL